MDSQRPAVDARTLNAYALNEFVSARVDDRMIAHLAAVTRTVIRCNANKMPPPQPNNSYHTDLRLPPSPPKTPPAPVDVIPGQDNMPPLEDFIKHLVRSSNVQVPTLMSTLVYLNRLKVKLQGHMGLRCTGHRLFLACLILTAKFLNDSSPKNKHWAAYSRMKVSDNLPTFGFSTTEVNLFERQAIHHMEEWENLRITEDDIYRELEPFLAPMREELLQREQKRAAIAAAEAEQRKYREEQRRLAEQQKLEQERLAAERWIAAQYSTPQSSPGSNWGHARQATPDSLPGLSSSYNSARSISSSHSYASSLVSRSSGAITPPPSYKSGPPSYKSGEDPYIYGGLLHTGSSLFEAPLIVEQPKMQMPTRPQLAKQKSLLPYEISQEELQHLQEGSGRVKRMRGVFGRMFGGSNCTPR